MFSTSNILAAIREILWPSLREKFKLGTYKSSKRLFLLQTNANVKIRNKRMG